MNNEPVTKYSEGGIVNPLPPDKVHKVQGIVTPKVPRQVAVERKEQLSTLPEELKDESLYFAES